MIVVDLKKRDRNAILQNDTPFANLSIPLSSVRNGIYSATHRVHNACIDGNDSS